MDCVRSTVTDLTTWLGEILLSMEWKVVEYLVVAFCTIAFFLATIPISAFILKLLDWIFNINGFSNEPYLGTPPQQLNALLVPRPAGMAADDSGELCAICRDTFTRPVITPCGHNFCDACIRAALSDQDLCPLCGEELFRPRTAAAEEESAREESLWTTRLQAACFCCGVGIALLLGPPAFEGEFLVPFIYGLLPAGAWWDFANAAIVLQVAAVQSRRMPYSRDGKLGLVISLVQHGILAAIHGVLLVLRDHHVDSWAVIMLITSLCVFLFFRYDSGH